MCHRLLLRSALRLIFCLFSILRLKFKLRRLSCSEHALAVRTVLLHLSAASAANRNRCQHPPTLLAETKLAAVQQSIDPKRASPEAEQLVCVHWLLEAWPETHVNRSPLPLPPTLVSGTPKQSEKLLLHHVLGDWYLLLLLTFIRTAPCRKCQEKEPFAVSVYMHFTLAFIRCESSNFYYHLTSPVFAE